MLMSKLNLACKGVQSLSFQAIRKKHHCSPDHEGSDTNGVFTSIRIFCLSRFRHQSVEVTLIIFVLNDIDRFFHCQQLV